MKQRFVFFFCLISSVFIQNLFAQGLTNNGAKINTTAGTFIYVDGGLAVGNFTNQDAGASIGAIDNAGTFDITGNWINNSISNAFTTNSGNVRLTGPAQTIGGTTTTYFNNLTLSGSGTKTLLVSTLVGGGFAAPFGKLDLTNRPLFLNSNTLIISNPNAGTGSIDDAGGGYIVSETNAASNPSIIQWNMGAVNGNYKFPFGDVGGVLIPFYLNKSGGAGDVSLATRPTNIALRDNQPWQTGVSNMFSPVVGGPGEVPVVVDRWWDINVSGTATAALTFTYQGTENTLAAAYQTGPFGAQTWYGSGWAPPTGGGPGVTVGTAQVVTPAQPLSTRPWVLSSITAPLPVEMISFDVNCDNKKAILKWTTASEIQNDYFSIERSADGVHFERIAKQPGAGTTNIIHHYSYTDEQPLHAISFYRIGQFDYNSASTYTNPITFDNCLNNSYFETYISNLTLSEPVLVINTSNNENFSLTVFDAAGRLVLNDKIVATSGITSIHFSNYNLSSGIYFLQLNGITHSESLRFGVLR